MGTLISVAAHGLRDRIAHSQRESAKLQERLREMSVQQDRDRIAAGDEEACLTVIEATARPHAADLDWAARKPAGLVEQAAKAGASIEIKPIPGGVRYALRLPLDGTAASGPGRLS